MSMVLPDYVTWTNVVVGAGERVTFNPDTREVVWDIGGVSSQTNNRPALRQVSFQIAFTPSRSQARYAQPLTGVANFTAHDTFTGATITDTDQALSTELPNDPAYTYEDSIVIP